MASALDQSLDEILASKPRRQFKKKSFTSVKVGKKTTAPSLKKKAPVKLAKDDSTVLDASYATKVIVYGLPKDTKQDAIKEFFLSQVGGVHNVALAYNEKGQSKGIATVIFRSSTHANEAVKKYNGAPIDGGASKLKLELIIDPTKKPLANRIVANANVTAVKAAGAKGKPKAKVAKSAKSTSTPHKKEKRNKRPAKKTLEQLDQEMADYFEKVD